MLRIEVFLYMKLTPENKEYIDSLSYYELLEGVRFKPLGDPWFQDDTGEYWLKRMKQMRAEPGGQERHVAASKNLG